MSEESRLGREAIETAWALKQIITAGVRVFYYLEDRERTLDSPTDKLTLSVSTFADELEREKARQRTTDAMRQRAMAGHVTGGRVFGYDNQVECSPDGKRLCVRRIPNEAEAAVVQRIFEECTRGVGLRRIAHDLNAVITEREGRRSRAEQELAALDQVEQARGFDLPRVEQDLRAKLADWRGLLARNVAQARQALRSLV